MDKKNSIIIVLTLTIVVLTGFFFYYNKKQQELQQQILRNMEYNAANAGSDGKGKAKDPYKEIAVSNALRKKAGNIQECYNEYLKTNPQKTDGFVEVDWNILDDGRVKRAELVTSDLNVDSLNKCILRIISSIEFPPPPTAGQVYITYKYNFKKVTEK